MKYFLVLFLVVTAPALMAQSSDETAIRELMHKQTEAWNRGDIPGFMEGYWKNDSLMFIGSRGVTYGWNNTLRNYQKSYPDTATMGKLRFDLIQVKKLSKEYYHVTGKWFLQRSVGDVGGHYTLLFRKIDGKWVIISDHSS